MAERRPAGQGLTGRLPPDVARALLRSARARLTPRPGSGLGAPESPALSVVIPVLDGGPRYVAVVEALVAQTPGPEAVEILVADSGSTDGATDTVAERFRAVRLFDVEQDEFDHGRVRTGLVLAARAPLVAILSADAKPVGQDYLLKLSEAFEDDGVAAVYARQVPRAGADPLVRAALERWTPPPEVAGDGPVVRPAPPAAFWETASPQEVLAASRIDNVASMVRRAVVLDIPFPPRSFGEDVSWGRLVAQAGWSLAYAPRAVVEHHHDPSPAELFSRNRRAHRQVAAEFGLRAVQNPLQGAVALVGESAAVGREHGVGWAVRSLPRRAAALAGQFVGGRDADWQGPTGPVLALDDDAPGEGFAVVMPAVAGSPHVEAALASVTGLPGAPPPPTYVVSEAEPPAGARWVRTAEGASYAERANQGFEAAAADGVARVVLLNDDVIVLRDALVRLAAALDDPGVGVAGAVLLEWDDDAIQHGGIHVGRSGRVRVLDDAPPGGPPCARPAVSGAAMAMRVSVWRRLGGFDERYTHFFEDVDLCLRARAQGLRSVLVPEARIRHRGGGTRAHAAPGTARLLGRNHARFALRLPGLKTERLGRLMAVSSLGLGWTLKRVGPSGVGAFLDGLREGVSAR